MRTQRSVLHKNRVTDCRASSIVLPCKSKISVCLIFPWRSSRNNLGDTLLAAVKNNLLWLATGSLTWSDNRTCACLVLAGDGFMAGASLRSRTAFRNNTRSSWLKVNFFMAITAVVPRELVTLKDFLDWAVKHFTEANLYYGHGTDNAHDEAIYLLFATLDLPFDSDQKILSKILTSEERDKLWQLMQQRIEARIPVAYLTQAAWFAGLKFYVDQRVLVPRSSLAELIEAQFSPWIKPEHVRSILDLGTGSGCIAIACAYAFPDAHVVATDISSQALMVAKINCEKHHKEKQIELVAANVFEGLALQLFDVIITNPPYVDAEDMDDLPLEYLHEPRLGLAAGSDGLDIVKKILREAKNYLNEKGILIVEVGNSDAALIEQYPHVPFTWLEFAHGEGGVFLLTKEQLETHF